MTNCGSTFSLTESRLSTDGSAVVTLNRETHDRNDQEPTNTRSGTVKKKDTYANAKVITLYFDQEIELGGNWSPNQAGYQALARTFPPSEGLLLEFEEVVLVAIAARGGLSPHNGAAEAGDIERRVASRPTDTREIERMSIDEKYTSNT